MMLAIILFHLQPASMMPPPLAFSTSIFSSFEIKVCQIQNSCHYIASTTYTYKQMKMLLVMNRKQTAWMWIDQKQQLQLSSELGQNHQYNVSSLTSTSSCMKNKKCSYHLVLHERNSMNNAVTNLTEQNVLTLTLIWAERISSCDSFTSTYSLQRWWSQINQHVFFITLRILSLEILFNRIWQTIAQIIVNSFINSI